MKLFFSILIFISFSFSSKQIGIEKYTVKYTGYHPLHKWSGISSVVESDLLCEKNLTECDINFSIPWFSFNSKNDNRDSNMLNHVNAFEFPNIYMEFKKVNINTLPEEKSLSAVLKINGVKNEILVPINYTLKDFQFTAKSVFQISLDDFNIKKPSLLFVPISNNIDIEVNLSGSFN